MDALSSLLYERNKLNILIDKSMSMNVVRSVLILQNKDETLSIYTTTMQFINCVTALERVKTMA